MIGLTINKLIMIYDDLDKIPMSRFIEVFMGNLTKVSDGELAEADAIAIAERLLAEYSEIVGGRSAIAEITKQNEMLNCELKIECMRVCEYLISEGKLEQVSKTLVRFGFKIPSRDKARIRQRVASILSTSQYRLEKLRDSRLEELKPAMSKDYFTRERIMLMEHFKMHIDIHKLSAKEYAYMVKKVCEETQAMLRSLKKK